MSNYNPINARIVVHADLSKDIMEFHFFRILDTPIHYHSYNVKVECYHVGRVKEGNTHFSKLETTLEFQTSPQTIESGLKELIKKKFTTNFEGRSMIADVTNVDIMKKEWSLNSLDRIAGLVSGQISLDDNYQRDHPRPNRRDIPATVRWIMNGSSPNLPNKANPVVYAESIYDEDMRFEMQTKFDEDFDNGCHALLMFIRLMGIKPERIGLRIESMTSASNDRIIANLLHSFSKHRNPMIVSLGMDVINVVLDSMSEALVDDRCLASFMKLNEVGDVYPTEGIDESHIKAAHTLALMHMSDAYNLRVELLHRVQRLPLDEFHLKLLHDIIGGTDDNIEFVSCRYSDIYNELCLTLIDTIRFTIKGEEEGVDMTQYGLSPLEALKYQLLK